MSATFTSPTTPTTGLQAYSLERGVKNLYPAPNVRWSRLRELLARKHQRRTPNTAPIPTRMSKDAPMAMKDTIEAMVDALSKSVSDVFSAATDEQTDLLKKNLGEFQTTLSTVFDEELAKGAPEIEEPLYKGLGTVGRVADLTSMIARRVQSIKDGKDYPSDENVDVPSQNVSEMLDHVVGMAELTLREAVNEHVDIPSEGEQPTEGVHFIAVPMLGGGESVVKCALPEELAKFATDPEQINEDLFSIGTQALLSAGVSEEGLEKMIAGEALAKAAPPPPGKKKTVPPGTDPAASDPTTGADPASDPSADPNADPGADPNDPGTGSLDGGPDDPLTVLGQLLAAAMIQVDHIQTMVEGVEANAPPADPAIATTAAGMPGAPPPMNKRAPEAAEPSVRAPTADELKKLVDERFEQEFGEFRPALEKILALPAEGKAVIGPAAVPSKQSDTTIETPLSSGPTEDELKKMAPADRMLAETKAAYRKPIPFLRSGA